MRALIALAAIAASLTAATATAAGDVTVASGVKQHLAWALDATDGPHGSFCITMRKQGRLDASECGSIYAGQAHGVTYLAHFGRPAPGYIVGPVVATARHVSVSFENGSRLSIPTIRPPQGLERNIRFYVRLMRCRSVEPSRIVGTDAAGHIVASIQLHSFAQQARTIC
jgi:hypothetical protein